MEVDACPDFSVCGTTMKMKMMVRSRLRLNETTHKSVRELFLPGGHAHDRDEGKKVILATNAIEKGQKRPTL